MELDEFIIIYTPYFYHRGLKRRIYAKSYGLESFALKIPRDKYRPRKAS